MSNANKLKQSTEYTKIYDYFYHKFAKQKKYTIEVGYKAEIIDNIFRNISWNEQIAIRAMIRYKSLDMAKKNIGISKKDLIKNFDLGTRHMYSPQNIELAVHGYYHIRGKRTPLTKADFDNRTYILTALNKAGIIYREQLFKHLNNGWYYLWTIPGCGDNARQKILMAIDKWKIE